MRGRKSGWRDGTDTLHDQGMMVATQNGNTGRDSAVVVQRSRRNSYFSSLLGSLFNDPGN